MDDARLRALLAEGGGRDREHRYQPGREEGGADAVEQRRRGRSSTSRPERPALECGHAAKTALAIARPAAFPMLRAVATLAEAVPSIVRGTAPMIWLELGDMKMDVPMPMSMRRATMSGTEVSASRVANGEQSQAHEGDARRRLVAAAHAVAPRAGEGREQQHQKGTVAMMRPVSAVEKSRTSMR